MTTTTTTPQAPITAPCATCAFVGADWLGRPQLCLRHRKAAQA